MMDETHMGACLCGAVRLEASGPPAAVAACHCVSCRRHTGAPFAVYADYPVARVRFTATMPATFAASPGATRGFCATCGSTVFFQGDNLPEMIHLHVGLFASAQAFQPQAEENTGARLPWVRVQLCEET